MSGGGGGGGSTDSVAYTNLLPTYIPNIQTWAMSYISQALALSIANFTAYPNPTYAAQNADETDGITKLATRGSSGHSIESEGETYLQSLISGNYIGANPYLDTLYAKKLEEILQKFTEDTLPNIADVYAFAWGGSEHNIEEAKAAERTADALKELGRTIYYDDHVIERRIQDAGLSHVIPYGMRAIRDAEMLRQAGVYAREYTQGHYTDNWKKWNENQILPIRNLDILGNAIKTILGTTRTTTTQYYKPSAFQEIAGVALTGLSIYSMFANTTRNPYYNPAGNKLEQGISSRTVDAKYETNDFPLFGGQSLFNIPSFEPKQIEASNQIDQLSDIVQRTNM